MSHLSVLADALIFLGKSIDPQAVTKVAFAFEHSPSDIGLDVWKFKVSLLGAKGIDDAGGTEVSFNLSFEGKGPTDEEAAKDSFKAVQEHIQSFHRLRENETSFAEQALLVLTSGIPAGIWKTEDTPPEVTHEAGESLNGHPSSV